jgi:hypothetical protein
VLLKHPGAVTAGAAGDGGDTGEFIPFVWHFAQTEALPVLVFV